LNFPLVNDVRTKLRARSCQARHDCPQGAVQKSGNVFTGKLFVFAQ
jgi:hypothetical protein